MGLAEERKFLHDISSPLSTLMLMVEGLKDDMETKKMDEQAPQMTKVLALLVRVSEMIHARRKVLISEQDSAAK